MSDALDRLCDLYGVMSWYSDIWGNTRHTSEAAKRATLAAMGVAAYTEEETLASFRAFEQRKWERALPPVQVVREPARPHRIAIALPAMEDQLTYRWQLKRESGAEDFGEFRQWELEEVERYHREGPDGEQYVRRMLTLDLPVEAGYHRF